MEFVTVTFPVQRPVFMDGQPMGQTGDPLMVEAGFHDFDLGSPSDYDPPTQTVDVRNTTPPNPLLVAFEPVETAVAAGTAAPRRRATRKARRRARPRKAAKRATRKAARPGKQTRKRTAGRSRPTTKKKATRTRAVAKRRSRKRIAKKR